MGYVWMCPYNPCRHVEKTSHPIRSEVLRGESLLLLCRQRLRAAMEDRKPWQFLELWNPVFPIQSGLFWKALTGATALVWIPLLRVCLSTISETNTLLCFFSWNMEAPIKNMQNCCVVCFTFSRIFRAILVYYRDLSTSAHQLYILRPCWQNFEGQGGILVLVRWGRHDFGLFPFSIHFPSRAHWFCFSNHFHTSILNLYVCLSSVLSAFGIFTFHPWHIEFLLSENVLETSAAASEKSQTSILIDLTFDSLIYVSFSAFIQFNVASPNTRGRLLTSYKATYTWYKSGRHCQMAMICSLAFTRTKIRFCIDVPLSPDGVCGDAS